MDKAKSSVGLEYDLTLEGSALYYENKNMWLEYHANADFMEYRKSDGRIRAIYEMPSREGFESMKALDNEFNGSREVTKEQHD